MKLILSVFTFAVTLALSATSVAAPAGHHDPLTEKMNSLYPPKQAKEGRNIIPTKPVLSAPTYFATMPTDRVELNWAAVEGADEYHVQVAKDPEFKWLIKNENHYKGTSLEVTNLEPGKHYYWRVSAVNNKNWNTFRKSYFANSMFETK